MFPRALLAAFLIAIGFVTSVVVTDRIRSAGRDADAQRARGEAGQPARPPAPIPSALPDLTGVAQHAIESVTNISSTQVVRTPNSPFANDPLLRYFFGDSPFDYTERRAQSLGSGVVVSRDGYVLTNSHVVENSAGVTVTLPDKRELPAKIVGIDEWTDLAVLRISAGNLPTLPWGDSSKLKVAEWVLAIGNPFQLNQTVTLGIVSATGRSVGLARYEDFIQTDAAINPGNSGGALVNARGELVGINSGIYSESGGNQGIGFAIPSNLARQVMDDLVKHGEVRRGTIPGIWIQPLTSELAERLNAPNTRGVLVYRIDQRSDAYAAGLRPGDIIVSFNGTPVDDTGQFMRLLADAPIGSTATLGVISQERQQTFKIPIEKATGGRTSRRGR